MTDSSMLKYQYETILDQLILLQLHAESPDCPCSLQGPRPGELGEYCEPKHLRSIVALARETISMEEDTARIDYLENLVLEGSELLGKMGEKLCDKEVDLGDYVTWSRDKRKPLEGFCYSGFCNIPPQEEEGEAIVEEVATLFRKKAEPRWCFPVKETDKELGKLYRTLGTARKRISEIQKDLEMPLNICRGQAEMFESSTGVLDPYGSRCRDPETGTWVNSLECGYEPAGITTTALGMDGITRYEFEFKIVSLDKLIISHDPFTFAVNPEYPEDLQPRLRGRAATKIQVEKIAANLEPDAVITDFHVIDRGTPIVGPDLVVEAGNGRVMGMIKAAADYPDKYANYKKSLSDRARDYGLSAKDVDSIENPVLIRVRITDVDRNTFAQEANQAATIAPSAIENARTDAQKITMGMLQELVIGENESLEDALRAPKNQAFAKRFLATLPENVQAALVDAQGYLNRDGVHRMAMAVFVSAFQGDPGLRLAEKAFESVDMDVRNTVNAIARSLGTLAQAEALTRTGERDTALSIGADLAQTVNVYSAIKRNPALTIEKYLAQKQIFARELTPFQEKILVVLEEYKRAPRKLANIFTAYAEGVIKAPPPAQAALIPGDEISKEGLWESAVKAPELQPAFMEVIKMFKDRRWKGPAYRAETGYRHDPGQTAGDVVRYEQEELGNDYGIGKDGLTYLDKFPAQAIKWVAKSKAVATHYNGSSPVAVEGHIIIAEDGDGGYLVLDPEREAKLSEQSCERPSVKYQSLSMFFTATAVEAALFAAEEGKIERKIDTILAQLQSGIEAIHESSKFKEFIDTMAKFHNYSLGNIMLITLQRPDATRVAGFRTWQQLGRNVMKGESGIMILAPCFPPKPKKEKKDEEDEEEIEREQVPVFFKVVHVFDIGQTSGEELPEVEVPVITGEETGPLFQAAAAYVAKQGITLGSDPKPDLGPDLMGFWRKSENLIWVRPDAPQDQRTKTLLHETAHSMCERRGARDAEVMAESVAYTVANHFGFDTGVRSFPYVAVWAGDVKVLKSNLEVIRKVSKDMIEGIEHVGQFAAGSVKMRYPFGDFVLNLSNAIKAENHLDSIDMQSDEAMQVINENLPRNRLLIKAALAKAGLADLAEVAKLFAPMKLLTKEIREKLPALYSQEEVEDPMVWVKFFTPDAQWTWYGIEFDGDATFFGWVVGHEKELGYFNLKELESVRGPMGLAIERDKWFKPMPLSEVKKLHAHEHGEMEGTYVQDMIKKYGLPFDPTRLKSAKGFRFKDRVKLVAYDPSGVPVGAQGTVWAIAGIKGHSICPDPHCKMLFVKWDEHGSQSVWITRVKKIGKLSEGPRNALPVFASLVPPETTSMEVSVSEEDLSGSITAIVRGRRVVTLTFQRGVTDGNVYDIKKMGGPGYEVYETPHLDQVPGARLSQGPMSAIGSAVITGIGIGTGFKIIEAVAKTFKKKRQPEGGDEQEEAIDEPEGGVGPEEGGVGPFLSDEEQEELEAVDQALKNAEEI